MDLSAILNPLNDAQRAAVTAPLGPVLVLAGAGSGKTRVLTHRIAWLIQAEGVSPHGILAVTFTNKAAGEMRARVERLLGVPGGGLWIGTFHGIAHRLLRLHWREANLAQGFQILDSEDQQRLIKKVIRAAELDETRWPPPGAAQGRERSDAPSADPALRRVRGRVRELGRRGLRGAAAARLRAVARQPRAPFALPAALPARAGR